MLKPVAACLGFVDPWETLRVSVAQAKAVCLGAKATESGSGQLCELGGMRSQGIPRVRQRMLARLTINSDMVSPVPVNWVERGFNKGAMVPTSAFVPGVIYPNLCFSSPQSEARQISSSPYVPGTL